MLVAVFAKLRLTPIEGEGPFRACKVAEPAA